jgi:dTDP-4-amino-4,6-dideoxygalactose transaminase
MTFVNQAPLFDLSAEDPGTLTHFAEVLRDGRLFRYVDTGRESANTLLERHLAGYFRKDRAVAVVNGTAGLRLALRAVGVGPGDRVLVSAYSFIACAMAVASIGAIPVPLDMATALTVDTEPWRVPPHPIAAVLVVHVQGHAIPVRPVRDLCDALGVPLIEDCCQGLGAEAAEGPAGALADIAVTSFQQAKQISTGEGGLLAGGHELMEQVYRMADLGAVRQPDGWPDWDDERAVLGENLRMTELQAALALDQAVRLDHTLARQRRGRRQLRDALHPEVAVLDSEHPAGDAGSHTLFRASGAQQALRFCTALAADGVMARVVWPRTFLEYGVIRRLSIVDTAPDAPHWPTRAVATAPTIVGLPVSKYVDTNGISRIAEAVSRHRRLLTDRSEVR